MCIRDSEIFWREEEYRSYRLISQSEENKLARARDTTGDGVSYSGSTTILTPPELKEKRRGTKELREKNAHTYARVLSLQHCFSVTAKEARFWKHSNFETESFKKFESRFFTHIKTKTQ